jgi:hypothetical protein
MSGWMDSRDKSKDRRLEGNRGSVVSTPKRRALRLLWQDKRRASPQPHLEKSFHSHPIDGELQSQDHGQWDNQDD